jgi:hypothetical protein
MPAAAADVAASNTEVMVRDERPGPIRSISASGKFRLVQNTVASGYGWLRSRLI